MFSKINQALVSKLAWKILTKRDTLWVRVPLGKYVKGRSFWAVSATCKVSWLWKSIVNVRHILWEGLCYQVGSGRNINIWMDPWVPLVPRFRPNVREGVNMTDNITTVRDLMVEDGSTWNVGLLNNIFTPESVTAIRKVRINEGGHDDSLFWPLDAKGTFSVKSIHSAILQ